MQQIDAAAIDTLGIPRLLLMDHAGVALAREAASRIPRDASPILICCGAGFNGGDGLAAARHLAARGYGLRIIVAGRLDHLREEPAVFAKIAQALALPLAECPDVGALSRLESWWSDCGLIIDALLGLGVQGPAREPIASFITRMNRSGKPIVSADLPSGLDGDTGRPLGPAVKATATVAFGLPKQGCVIGEGPAYAGSLVVDPITIPQSLLVP